MTLHLRPTNGLTLEAFLEENGDHIYKHSGPYETWNRCGSDRFPVIVFQYDEYKVAHVAIDLGELGIIFDRASRYGYEIYLVKIVDLLPHVERLEVRMKERLRRESTKRRIGRFAIPFNLLETADPFARAILDKVFIVRAEAQLYSKEVSYIAYSDMFDEIQIGLMVPGYLWTATTYQSGKIIDLKADRMA